MKQEIIFSGRRIDNGEEVKGMYFIAPLTDENSGTDPCCGWFFLTGETKHCISTNQGVVYVVIPESVKCETYDKVKETLDELFSIYKELISLMISSSNIVRTNIKL